MSQRTDQHLWSDVTAAGGGDAFGALFDRHVQAVYRHCFRLTGSWTAAEDATQSTFLLAWRKRGEARLVDDSILPWLLAVASHVVRDQRRSLGRWRRALLRLPPEPAATDFSDEVAGRVDSERRMVAVLRGVRRLPRAERDALALCVWSGIAYADAAVVLGVNEAAVRTRVSRARRRLIRLLGPEIDPSSGPGESEEER
ncbi:RNA polymerase sigma factor [Micromonospora endophytica]|uniref:RNA polymerase subunit sigma-70 n=1 Tax=Micromonospora endophytica TaxID=515350 RepID=A0A2W2DN71_9ACTN|nr:RNA polymerase sigma factor [Micromonospora endophytica]PZF98596.1 RNA polymerase subunit sigma-70 [Micromonospora endophytica]RIW41808.1 RNA polymerase sigma factor [Micromonospora endophytica]